MRKGFLETFLTRQREGWRHYFRGFVVLEPTVIIEMAAYAAKVSFYLFIHLSIHLVMKPTRTNSLEAIL